MLNRRLTATVVLLLASIAVHAEPRQITVDLDPQKTKIEWTVGDVLHSVHGTFQMKRGSVKFNPGTHVVLGEIVVDAASGESGNGVRDRRMKKEILETQRYPEATFVPSKIDGTIAMSGTSSAQLTGTLDIHGSKHQITVPMNFDISGTEVKADGTFVIPYVAWGMKDPSTFVLRVEKNVNVVVKAVGHVVASNAARSSSAYPAMRGTLAHSSAADHVRRAMFRSEYDSAGL